MIGEISGYLRLELIKYRGNSHTMEGSLAKKG